ncbi:MAG TPA: hypothetical protein VG225_12570 [Terracidiphilus sp.]|jgi:hypothetical protein|nr:hypothetical protein [Terracidiphilus sp.]
MAEEGFTPFTEPERVEAYLQPVLQTLALAFSAACEQTAKHFADKKWSPDAGLSAYMTRKLVLETLRIGGADIEEEQVEIEPKALCGLLLRLPLVHLKVRKSRDGEIPPAGSEQSLSFYNWNLIVFPQGDDDEPLPLHVLLLWNEDRKGNLETLLLVCVEGNQWRWRIPIFQRTTKHIREIRSRFDEPSETGNTKESYFEAAFDSANEDVPLKLNDPPAENPELRPNNESATGSSKDDQLPREKKANES